MLTFLHVTFYLMAVLALARCAGSTGTEKPLWTDIPQAEWQGKGIQVQALRHYRVLELDTVNLKKLLDSQKGEPDIRKASTLLPLPLPDGTFARFRFAVSATSAPGPAGSQAASSTFFGQGAEDASLGVAFDLGLAGFHAMITLEKKTAFIEPFPQAGGQVYLCYYKHDLKPGYRKPFVEYGPIRQPNKR